jgi:hypothetical protein
MITAIVFVKTAVARIPTQRLLSPHHWQPLIWRQRGLLRGRTGQIDLVAMVRVGALRSHPRRSVMSDVANQINKVAAE